ncbi:MAG TPA: porin PorA family protein [Candidatus Nanopelagicales bacterium]
MEPGTGSRRRRILARAALLLGLLLLVAAPILRFWVTPLLAQSPRLPGGGGFVTATSTGTLTALFDLEDPAGTPAVVTPIPITRTVTTRGDAAATQAAEAQGSNVAVTDSVDRVVTDDGRLVAETQFRLAADRHTQALLDCCGVQVSGTTVPMAGAGSPLRLPWFTPQATYPYFDPTLLTAVDLAPIGTDRVGDADALKFQQATAPTAVGTVQVPGRLVGSERPFVTLTRAHAVTRTLWVEPTTGIILRSAERIRDTLRDDAGRDVVTLATMTLASTPAAEAAAVATARAQAQPVLWAHAYGPALCVAASVLLLLLGIVLVVREVRAARVEQDFPDEWATFDDLKEAFD